MPEADILDTIAQLAVGLAGFSGIAVVLSRRPGRLSDVERYRLFIMLATSLGALFLSLVPAVLYIFDLSAMSVWRYASASMLLFTLLFLAVFLTRTRRFIRDIPVMFSRYHLSFVISGHVVNSGIQALNAAAIIKSHNSGYYILGLLWILLHSALQFARILFVPTPKRRPSRLTAASESTTRDERH